MSFTAMGLSAPLLRALTEKGYEVPTPIQKDSIPHILKGKDVLASAQTGTGKTASFTLPMLQILSERPMHNTQKRPIRALVLTPTRELAAQVEESIYTYGKYLQLRSTVVFGGVGIVPQIQKLRSGVDILVATPGRLMDHISQGNINLREIEFFVLDEADRMLDMGFIHDIRKILRLLPVKKQTLLFSATFSKEIKTLANGLLHAPVTIEISPEKTTAERVSQIIYKVDKKNKRALLSHLIRTHHWKQILVFMRTKHGANKLVTQLEQDGITALAIHGNKSQGARVKALSSFKDGKIQALVATDVAARGLDIDDLPHVINFELPNVPEDYVHRIGRTGRAGKEGIAISLVCVDEFEFLRDIEKLLKTSIRSEVLKGFEPDPSIRAEPIVMGGGRGGNRGGHHQQRRSFERPKQVPNNKNRFGRR